MIKSCWLLVACAVAAYDTFLEADTSPVTSNKQLTIEDHVTMPQPTRPRFAPDGKRIAYVLTKADLERNLYDSDVWLIQTDGSGDRQLTRSVSADFNPQWSPDGKSIAFLSDRAGRMAIWIIPPDGGETRQLTKEPTPVREFAWSPDGKSIAFTRLDDALSPDDGPRVVDKNIKHIHLYLADVADGTVRKLTSGDFSIFNFDWSPDGSTIAYARGPRPGLDGQYLTDIYALSLADGATRPIIERPGIDYYPVYSPDGKSIAFASSGGVRDWVVEHDVYVVAATGGAPRLVSKEYGGTPDSILWTDDGIWIEAPLNTTTQLIKLGAAPASGRPSRQGLITDPDVHAGKAAYIFQTLTAPPELWLDDKQLTHHNAAYTNRTLGETRVIRWKNLKDRLEIEGLLTLPVGYKPGTRVPLLTFVHGGPASRFDQGFLGYLGQTYAPQTLAAAGFAVFRPNPRGSAGYGLPFRAANLADWTGMPWLDIESGIDQVIADGIADPNRLGLMGWSYGGYLAAWALGHSDRFRAISIGAAIVDLLSFHGTTDVRDYIPFYFPGLSRDVLRAQSPLWNLKKTAAKVLIQHGENDERVPLSQGVMLYRILQELGVDATMVVYPRMGHGTREPKLRLDLARRNYELFWSAVAKPPL